MVAIREGDAMQGESCSMTGYDAAALIVDQSYLCARRLYATVGVLV